MNKKTFKKLLKTEEWKFRLDKEGWGDMDFTSFAPPEDAVKIFYRYCKSLYDPNVHAFSIRVVFDSGKEYKIQDKESFVIVIESIDQTEDSEDLLKDIKLLDELDDLFPNKSLSVQPKNKIH